MNIILPKEFILEENAIQILSSHELTKNKNVLLLFGSNTLHKNGIISKIENIIKQNNSPVYSLQCANHEPNVSGIDRIATNARFMNIDIIVAVGGGSTIDTAKAISVLIHNNGSILEYIDNIKKIDNKVVPIISIPTTAGTGSEATKNSVITIVERKIKKSLRDDRLVSRLIILDPALLSSLRKETIAYGGFDCLGQLIESYTSSKSNIFTDSLSLNGIELAIKSFKNVYDDSSDTQSWKNMLLASLYSGICLTNGGLGAAHGISSVLAGKYNIGHGLTIAVALPYVIDYNISHARQKFDDIENIISKYSKEKNVIDYIRNLQKHMNIPNDFKHVSEEDVNYSELANMANTGSMLGNTYQLSIEEIEQLFKLLL